MKGLGVGCGDVLGRIPGSHDEVKDTGVRKRSYTNTSEGIFLCHPQYLVLQRFFSRVFETYVSVLMINELREF